MHHSIKHSIIKRNAMYTKHNFTEKVLFTSHIPYHSLSLDIEYAVDCIITVDTEEGTAEGFEITRCAIQNGVYDDGELISMSAWALIDTKLISPNTFSVIEASICQLFFDALEKGGGDGEYESEDFPVLPALVVSEYAPIL